MAGGFQAGVRIPRSGVRAAVLLERHGGLFLLGFEYDVEFDATRRHGHVEFPVELCPSPRTDDPITAARMTVIATISMTPITGETASSSVYIPLSCMCTPLPPVVGE